MASVPSGSDPLKTLLGEFSVEVTSVDKKSIEAACRHFARDTEVFVASLPKEPPARLISAARQLREAGLVPVPHIVARNIATATELDSLLRGLADEAGVDRALVLGGDREVPAGEYDYSLQLIESGRFEAHRMSRLYFSCYPEGHPGISRAKLDAARTEKLAAARERGFEVCLISQFCFDARPIIDWSHELRSIEQQVPYRVGVAGPASRANLLRFALLCGVGPSLRVLRQREQLARNVLQGETPEALLREVAEAQKKEPALGISGVHFFTFGSLVKTAEWIASARA